MLTVTVTSLRCHGALGACAWGEWGLVSHHNVLFRSEFSWPDYRGYHLSTVILHFQLDVMTWFEEKLFCTGGKNKCLVIRRATYVTLLFANISIFLFGFMVGLHIPILSQTQACDLLGPWTLSRSPLGHPHIAFRKPLRANERFASPAIVISDVPGGDTLSNLKWTCTIMKNKHLFL